MNQSIGLKQQNLGVTEIGGQRGNYPGARRQVSRRLNEIDNAIAKLKAEKAKLLKL
ncbi:MAG: hypothetical protein KJO69_08595 [Gammaproteobacteria bacterium]|nr:hypothetical protein [Gammaproteobacteria bacterium]